MTLHGERQAFVEAPVFENSYIQKWKWSVEIDWTMKDLEAASELLRLTHTIPDIENLMGQK